MENKLAFSALKGALIAVYANPRQDPQKRRFWLAEALANIPHTSKPGDIIPVFYYTATHEDYTKFSVEGGRKKRVYIEYSMCIGRVSSMVKGDRLVEITPHERDRLTALGVALDKEKEDEEEEEEEDPRYKLK